MRIEKVRKLAAFVLQGQESFFIHHLTILASKFGYRIMANEHDGLITIGEIPKEAITEASRLSGLKYARLVEKPFEGAVENTTEILPMSIAA
jgi:hypothetical protein